MAERALFELTDAKRLPHLLAELRRFRRADAEWYIDNDGIAWVRIADAPPATLYRADDSARVYVEQSPDVWVAWMRPQSDERVIPSMPFRSGIKRFHVVGETPVITDLTQTLRVAVKPRLVIDREPGTAEMWVLSDETKLLTWLARADDRLVARLEVARLIVSGAAQVVLLWRGGRGGPPVLVLEADAYRPYLKLPNLFIPVGKKLVPPLRRDLAKRAFAPESDHIVWLGNDGSMTSLPMSAFHPLIECIRYEKPMVTAHAAIAAEPIVTLDSYEAKDRPAGARIDLATGDSAQQGRLAMIWSDDQWRLKPSRGKIQTPE